MPWISHVVCCLFALGCCKTVVRTPRIITSIIGHEQLFISAKPLAFLYQLGHCFKSCCKLCSSRSISSAISLKWMNGQQKSKLDIITCKLMHLGAQNLNSPFAGMGTGNDELILVLTWIVGIENEVDSIILHI